MAGGHLYGVLRIGFVAGLSEQWALTLRRINGLPAPG
jgi:hypothetical protein